MDLEKGIKTEAIGAPDAQIPTMAGGISDLRVVVPEVITGGGVIVGNMNPGKNKSLRCWLVVTASAMFLTNYIQAAPKFQLIPMEPMVIFMMFMCAILLVYSTMKQM